MIVTCLNCGKTFSDTKNGRRRKYCSHTCQMEYQQKMWEQKWLSGEISAINENDHTGNVPHRIRTYLFRKYNSKCSICGWGEVNPFSGKIPLEVHHKDGNHLNYSEDNLELLCPNCHSLTKTYKAMNLGNGRVKRRKTI